MDSNGMFSGTTGENNTVENNMAESSAETVLTSEIQQTNEGNNNAVGADQNPYASPYEAQNTYSAPYNSQNVYASANETQNTQNAYSAPYNENTQSAQNSYSTANTFSSNDTQYAYENQINQNAQYTYGSNNNQSGPNYYADTTNTNTYSYGGQNTDYQNYQSGMEIPVSVGEWLLTFLLFCIPCVGFVMAIVWAFSKTEKSSKVNYCRAYLIMQLIGLVLSLVIFCIMLVVML